MADKITAPVGSHFMLQWTTDAYVEMVNRFHVRDKGVERVEESPGRPPKKGNEVKGKFVPVPLKGKVTADLKITKDGQPSGFKDKKLQAEHTEILKKPEFIFQHLYSFVFVARAEGEYVFTVEYAFEPSPNKSSLTSAPPTLTQEVKVVPAEPLNDRRKDMLALIDKWLPSSVFSPRAPGGESQDILARCGWDSTSTKVWSMPAPEETLPMEGSEKWTQSGVTITALGEGQRSSAKRSYNDHVLPKRQAAYDAKWPPLPPGTAATDGRPPRPAGIAITTSCISVMSELVKLWGNQFSADLNTMVNADPSHYVVANEEFKKSSPQLPKPGDILYLGKEENRGEFQHTCILVSASSQLWVTADGGGGALPDQTATVVNKPLSWTKAKPGHPAVPMFESVTDGKIKALHGWVDIDKVPNDKYNADGSRK